MRRRTYVSRKNKKSLSSFKETIKTLDINCILWGERTVMEESLFGDRKLERTAVLEEEELNNDVVDSETKTSLSKETNKSEHWSGTEAITLAMILNLEEQVDYQDNEDLCSSSG